MPQIKILLQSQTPISYAMSGPSIRYWEFAKMLAKSFDVTLSAPKVDRRDLSGLPFKMIETFAIKMSHYDVVVTQQITHAMAWKAKRSGVKLILDAYDPMALENLEIFKPCSLEKRRAKNARILERTNFSLRMADGILCANEEQKSLWTGFLLSQHLIAPEYYDTDPALNNLIAIVPFGLSEEAPVKNPLTHVKKSFNIPLEHKLVVWGGGIWNWFDPLTLIEAMAMIKEKRADIHLLFMGGVNTHSETPDTLMARRALALAKKLELYQKNVHFNTEWVPYDKRADYLIEADIGVSTHFDHLETRYSFRTRILDYLWASLPMVVTEGDCFAKLVQSKELGLTVSAGDPQALAKAIEMILSDEKHLLKMKERIQAISPTYFWSSCVKPLEEMVYRLSARKNISSIWDYTTIVSSFGKLNSPKALFNELSLRFGK